MAGGIDDIDLVVLVVDGSILSQNGDAALTLQITGVHDSVLGSLILAVDAALLQQLVHQSGLAVVNVGDDRNIADFILRSHKFSLLVKVSFNIPST